MTIREKAFAEREKFKRKLSSETHLDLKKKNISKIVHEKFSNYCHFESQLKLNSDNLKLGLNSQKASSACTWVMRQTSAKLFGLRLFGYNVIETD